MMDHIFRQYDIRGKVGSEFPLDKVYDLTQAIISYFLAKNPSLKTVAVGADGRTHSPAVKQEMCRALQDAGINVLFVGVCPTPVLYFSLFNCPVDAGLMITASHNGKEYNGIKMCLAKDSVWGLQIQEIKALFQQGVKIKAQQPGTYTEINLIERYVPWMADQFTHLKGSTLPLVIDCGNGAGGTVLPSLIKAMEWKHVTVLCGEVDGNYPNHEADPTVDENMVHVKEFIKKHPGTLGIGLDGDCDRMVAATSDGALVQGDKLLAVFSKPIIEQYPGTKVVFDIKCSSGLSQILSEWGAIPCISASGHSIIKDQMKKQGALLAGELSCHFFFSDRYFGYDDALYAMLRLIEIVTQTGKTLDELLAIFPARVSTKEIRIACKEEQKNAIVETIIKHFLNREQAQLLTIDGIRVSMPYGWGLLRASNTQPVMCLRFEADTPQNLRRIVDDFIRPLASYFDKTFLEEQVNLPYA